MAKTKYTKEDLIKDLIELQKSHDYEIAHYDADKLLLKFIDDDDVIMEFHKINKYYAWHIKIFMII